MDDSHSSHSLEFPLATISRPFGRPLGQPPGIAKADRPRAPQTIVIVGAGFCGTLVAVNLLRQSHRPLRVVLVDREEIGRGVAYARREYPFLLNVPAGRMSANSADPLEFLAYAWRRLPDAGAEDFLPRKLYGDYLQSLLSNAELMAPAHTRLERLRGAVIAVERVHRSSRLDVHLEDGRAARADVVVLALGNPPPAPLPGAETLRGSARYLQDPWQAPLQVRAGERLLIAGSGLTMADIALAANSASGGRVIIHAISRHGLIPPPQTSHRPLHDEETSRAQIEAAGSSMRQLFRTVRALSESPAGRHDWRETIGIVRNLAPALWGRLPEAEKERFLRHVRSYWEIHRHRLPQSAWSAIDALRREGRLHIHAGRICELRAEGRNVRVSWRARGKRRTQTVLVERVINCTGPDFNVQRTRDRLLRSLLAQGMAQPHPLGLKTDTRGALVDARGGGTARNLYYIGALLRAAHWETTAVPELREHAERLAQHLLSERHQLSEASVPARRAALA
jgi:uncharacterized NAD(P)/FAD-binding protein YdhS